MDNRPLVCDIGTGTTKVGFAGEDAPRAVFPTIIDIPHHTSVRIGIDANVVDEAQSKRRAISLKYPIEHGIVRNWDGMEKIWNRIFDDELHVDPKEHPVLWTEPPLNPKVDRQTMAQLMFETFNVPSIFITPQTFLSMQAGGHITGIMLHCGDGVSYAVPGLGNCCRPHCAIRLDVAGGDITDYLMTSLREGGCYHMLERETVREMKEKLGYVAYDYEQELERSSSIKKDYLLPDGRVLTIGADRFRGPEVLFRPSLIGREGPGIHEMAYNSIRKYYDEAYSVDDSCRKVFNNILLTGGSTMFPGFVERMEKEITALDRLEKSPLADLRKRIIAPPERRWSAWIGGSIMAIQDEFPERCISKTEYEERGPSILYKRLSNFWDVPTWC